MWLQVTRKTQKRPWIENVLMMRGDLINMNELERKVQSPPSCTIRRNKHPWSFRFLSVPFCSFLPRSVPLLFHPPLLLSISLFLSVKVMQLIFLCLFIFQDWLWNVGSRQKPHRPLLSIRLLHPPLFPLLTAGAHHFPKPCKQDPMRRNATPKLFLQCCRHPTPRALPLLLSLFLFHLFLPPSLTLLSL